MATTRPDELPVVDKVKTKRSRSFLEKFVANTKKFKIEDLLLLYTEYDSVVIEDVFCNVLFPYTRMGRSWIGDQAKDLLAGTDRNRLILTSRFRKESEEAVAAFDPNERDLWAQTKPRNVLFLQKVFSFLRKHAPFGSQPTREEVTELGLSRLVLDDLGAYVAALLGPYPMVEADLCAAIASGDHHLARTVDAYLRVVEAEVGVRREDGWFVALSLREAYDRIEAMIQTVSLSYSRLLYRFAYGLQGVTSTDENFSAGFEGMIRAARNYDPNDGGGFAGHCRWWVRSSIMQRLRQSSVIRLPNTTWYQLSLIRKGESDLSDDRINTLREREKLFYATSNKRASPEEDIDASLEADGDLGPDARLILGDGMASSQEAEALYEQQDYDRETWSCLLDAIVLLQEEDPALLFPFLLWGMHSGIDPSLMARAMAPIFVSAEDVESEKQRQQSH